jgi:hypothetical protein
MFHYPLLIRRSALIAMVAIVMFWSGDRVLAAQRSGERVLFGPIGVTQGEAVRVNVYGISDPDDVPWDFVVRVFNTRGEIGVERRLTVAPGVTRSVEVNIGNPDIFPVDRLGRRTVRAEIVGFNPQPDPPGLYVATLEVYDARTGTTNTLLGGADMVGDQEYMPSPGVRGR